MCPPLVVAITTVAVLLAAACTERGAEADAAKGRVSKTRQWLYVIPASFRAAQMEARLAGADVLCLGVYRLDRRGKLYARPRLPARDRELLARMRVGRRLYPLISLRHAGAGRTLLRSPTARARAVRALDRLIGDERYDGIHIDFEYLHGKDLPYFLTFLRELRRAPQMRGRTLSMAAFPPLHGTKAEAAFFNTRALAKHVDQIVYMTYDYHLRRPGPVTHLGWAERNMQLVLKDIAPERIWLGVPGYGYEWSASKKDTRRPRVVSEFQTRRLCARHACARDASGMLRLERRGRIAYLPDPQLRERMHRLAAGLRLRGTALWRVGFELAPGKP